jgi:hypothetical protein
MTPAGVAPQRRRRPARPAHPHKRCYSGKAARLSAENLFMGMISGLPLFPEKTTR